MPLAPQHISLLYCLVTLGKFSHPHFTITCPDRAKTSSTTNIAWSSAGRLSVPFTSKADAGCLNTTNKLLNSHSNCSTYAMGSKGRSAPRVVCCAIPISRAAGKVLVITSRKRPNHWVCKCHRHSGSTVPPPRSCSVSRFLLSAIHIS